MTKLTKEQQLAYNWAKAQNYPSVATTYAKILVGVIDQLRGELDELKDDPPGKKYPTKERTMKVNVDFNDIEAVIDLVPTVTILERAPTGLKWVQLQMTGAEPRKFLVSESDAPSWQMLITLLRKVRDD